MKKIVTLVLSLMLGTAGTALAQPHGKFTGAYNVPGIPFNTLTKLLDTLNYYGVSGPVTIRLTADQTAPSGGYLLGSDSLQLSLSPTNDLKIQGNGHWLTAPTGSGSTDGIFKIQGADYVTIDNMNLKESSTNTTATTMMEWGYAVVRRTSSDAVKSLTIQKSKIVLNNSNTTSASGISPLGATGIFIGSCLPNSTAALAASPIDSGSHSGIFLFQDTIENTNNGVYANGSLTVVDGFGNNDNGLTVQACQLANFTHYGIYISQFNFSMVKGNYLDNMAAGGTAPTANSIFGIRYATPYATAYNNGWTSENNNVKLTINTPAGSYHATGVSTQNKGTGITSLSGDTIQLTSIGASAQLNGIFSQNTNGSQTIRGNVVRKFSTKTTNAQAVIGIFSGGYSTYAGLGVSDIDCYPVSATMSDNIIDSFEVASGTASVFTSVFACLDDNLTANVSPFINNRVNDINIIAPSSLFIGYGGIWRRSATLSRITNVNSNIFTRISATGTANTTPMIIVRPTGPYPNVHTVNVTSNKFTNITAGDGRLTVMDLDDAVTGNISKDTLSELAGNFHVIGFLTGNSSAGYATKTIQVDNTYIGMLKSTAVKSGALTAGIYTLPGSVTTTQSLTIYNSMIHNLVCNDTLGSAFGINIPGGTATCNIYNNMISDIAAAADTAAFNSSFGINLRGTGTNKIQYNTINMRPGATTATGYGASGIVYASGGNTTVQNNIVRVNVAAGLVNNVAAIRAASGAATAAPSSSAFTASNNIYFAPTGPNNYLYVEGTTNSTLVNGFNTAGLTENATKNIVNDTFFNSDCGKSSYHKFMNAALPSREQGTFTENNLIGSAGNYVPAGISYAEAGAMDLGITTDITGATRPGGTADIGAREFSGTPLPEMFILVTSNSGKDTACVFNLPTLTLSIPDYYKRVSYQWYKDTARIAGATGTKLLVDADGGTYIAKVFDSATGCEYASPGFKMTIVPPPAAAVTYYDSLVFCETSAVVLYGSSGSGYTYQWYKDGAIMTPETKDHYVASKTGLYSVEINTPFGCPTLSEAVKVTVYPLPDPTIFWVGPHVLSTQKYYTYQWYKNNIKIDSFATGQTYFAMDDGAYTVEVTDSNGCTAKSSVFLFTVGVKEQQLAAAIKVFPNPSSDLVQIESPEPVFTELTDMAGRHVLARELRSTIQLGSLAEGMYLLTLSNRDGVAVRKEKITKIK